MSSGGKSSGGHKLIFHSNFKVYDGILAAKINSIIDLIYSKFLMPGQRNLGQDFNKLNYYKSLILFYFHRYILIVKLTDGKIYRYS